MVTLETFQTGSKEWLKDSSGIRLRANASMTPREWLRDGILVNFCELQGKAKIIFEEVCSDKLQI